MSEKDKEMLRIKFDIVHFIATQQLAFTNYPALCELEKKHGVNVGVSCSVSSRHSCKGGQNRVLKM